MTRWLDAGFVDCMDEMVDAYIECALWADCAPLDPEGEYGGLAHLQASEETIKGAIAHCSMFYMNNRTACDAYLDEIVTEFQVWEMLGHDLRLMESGHGAGPDDRQGVSDATAKALRIVAPKHVPLCYQVDENTAAIDF